MKWSDLKEFKNSLAGYFDLSSFLIPQAEAEEAIREGVSFRGINILILIVAIFIASLGLNTNSTAVIIGAMLISPLMGPIIGMGLAVGIHDFDLMKRSFRNLLMATIFSVATSCVFFLISPVNEGHSELLARTSPTIYDVFIGFFGGAAGILAIGSRVKGNVIPGVAIATALMPPLCTVGYGLATFQMNFIVLIRNAERFLDETAMRQVWSPIFGILYLCYDLEKEFLPQFRENAEKLLRGLQMIAGTKTT